MSVEAATERDLDEIRVVAPDLAESALALVALELARQIDMPKNSATSKSMCARVLADVLGQLRELTPPRQEGDKLDGIKSQRALRLAGGTEA